MHVEVTDAIGTLRGGGLPYVIDHYRVMSNRPGDKGLRDHQLPLDSTLIDFGK